MRLDLAGRVFQLRNTLTRTVLALRKDQLVSVMYSSLVDEVRRARTRTVVYSLKRRRLGVHKV